MLVFLRFWALFLVVLGSRRVKFGHFQALETPSGDLGLQGSILGPSTSRNTSFGGYFVGSFLHFWGYVFEVRFWKASGPLF